MKEKNPQDFFFLSASPLSPSPWCGLLFSLWRDRDEEMFQGAWQGDLFM